MGFIFGRGGLIPRRKADQANPQVIRILIGCDWTISHSGEVVPTVPTVQTVWRVRTTPLSVLKTLDLTATILLLSFSTHVRWLMEQACLHYLPI